VRCWNWTALASDSIDGPREAAILAAAAAAAAVLALLGIGVEVGEGRKAEVGVGVEVGEARKAEVGAGPALMKAAVGVPSVASMGSGLTLELILLFFDSLGLLVPDWLDDSIRGCVWDSLAGCCLWESARSRFLPAPGSFFSTTAAPSGGCCCCCCCCCVRRCWCCVRAG
jgi:hypothetical protein